MYKLSICHKVPYPSVGGWLMYVMDFNILDLTPAVSQLCKFVTKLGKRHWETYLWVCIFRHMKSTVYNKSWYRVLAINIHFSWRIYGLRLCELCGWWKIYNKICFYSYLLEINTSIVQSIVVMSAIEKEYMTKYECEISQGTIHVK